MKTVTVKTSKAYPVFIGNGLLPRLGQFIAELIQSPCKAAIISDTNVWSLYGATAEASLQSSGFKTVHYCFSAGEASKNSATYIEIVNFLAENKLTRADLIIALGGGVVGDITGFAAATFLRGVPYIQVPTTLLAMVDSSVGGKTAIDLPAGKNLVGAFYQPKLVVCDLDALDTLPNTVFLDGCAEVIKYGVLFDEELFHHLLQHGPAFDRPYVIERCIAWKRNVVVGDEFDLGERQKLNLGHTIGHSVELCSNYTVSHGHAVAIGMAIIARSACTLGICSAVTAAQIQTVLKAFSLPATTVYTAEQLYSAALTDKKRTGSTVNLIVPEAIGNCSIRPTPVSQLQSLIEAGL